MKGDRRKWTGTARPHSAANRPRSSRDTAGPLPVFAVPNGTRLPRVCCNAGPSVKPLVPRLLVRAHPAATLRLSLLREPQPVVEVPSHEGVLKTGADSIRAFRISIARDLPNRPHCHGNQPATGQTGSLSVVTTREIGSPLAGHFPSSCSLSRYSLLRRAP